MKSTRLSLLALLVLLALIPVLAAACANWGGGAAFTATRIDKDDASINATLNALHHAAATADEDTYFGLYAPGAVFLGTDATERWSLAEFRAYAAPYFQRESAWVYTLIERHISHAGKFAWFDERLMNDRFGETRGSGVLRKIHGAWRIAQYNLAIPIPNDLAVEVARRIRESAR